MYNLPMIIPPFAAPRDFKSAVHPQDEKEVHWFVFSGDLLLVNKASGSVPVEQPSVLLRSLYIGSLENKHLFTGEVEKQSQAPQGWHWSHLRELFDIMKEEDFAIAGRALQLIEWDRSHQFCGRCGSSTFLRQNERCRECTACGHLAYPKIAPVILALVKRDEKILLARNAHFPEKFFSVIAGFVDPGETLEQCVAREVFEEVGIQVKNIRYFGSQPWPLSGALMIAFTCEWEKGEIHIDPSEIAEAAWFDRSHFPELPPLLSLARILIDSN